MLFCGDGYAEYAIGPARLVYPIPEGLAWEEGAAEAAEAQRFVAGRQRTGKIVRKT